MHDEPAARYEVRDHIGIITLNRPSSLNAVNAAMCTAVGQHLEDAARDDEVRVVVITGAGRAFCAGADLKEIAHGRTIAADNHPEWGFAGLVRHWIDKPMIAAVNGYAMGGGTEIVLACDLAIASSAAMFGLPEVKRGLMAAAGGVVRIQRQLPLKRALEVALIGDPVDAETALESGLVNAVVDPDDLVSACLDMAAKIASNAPLAVQHTKRAIHRNSSGGSDWHDSWSSSDPWRVNAQEREIVFTSRDAVEGPRAFSEKRQPVWQGR